MAHVERVFAEISTRKVELSKRALQDLSKANKAAEERICAASDNVDRGDNPEKVLIVNRLDLIDGATIT